jgi:GR25 family glycosyltransferase involved in LPS biosynthesis
LEGVDCIYVINLDERHEKWARVKPLFDARGLMVNRVSGIIGKNLSNEFKRELLGPYFPGVNGGLGSGHIGCFLSHLSIMKDAYERGCDVIWVMEDDVEFIEDIQQIPNLLKSLSSLDPLWDVCYTDIDTKNNKGEHVPSLGFAPRLDQNLLPPEYYLTRTRLNENIMKIGQRFGMYSVFMSKRGLKKMIEYFSHVYLWCPIDIDIHYIPNIRQYSFTRDIVSHWSGNDFSDTLCPETSTLK